MGVGGGGGLPRALNRTRTRQARARWLWRPSLDTPAPRCAPAQAEANTGALGWRLSGGDVGELDEAAVEGSLKLGQHG